VTVAARLVFALFLSVSCLAASASAAPVQGTDYSLITPPQQQISTPANKVEVVEFFSYGCPHCFHMQPLLNKWKKDLPANAVLIKVPVSFGRREWGQLVRAYYTLQALGALDRLDDALFNGIHEQQKQLWDGDALTAWAAENGIDANKFRTTFNSEEISKKAMMAEQLSRDYKINGVPTITVAGKYKALGKDFPDMLHITSELIDQAAHDK
jgi:thiol:disulfide interchange protein DsbA